MYRYAVRRRKNKSGADTVAASPLTRAGRDQVRRKGEHAGSTTHMGIRWLPDCGLALGKPTEGPWGRVKGCRVGAWYPEPKEYKSYLHQPGRVVGCLEVGMRRSLVHRARILPIHPGGGFGRRQFA